MQDLEFKLKPSRHYILSMLIILLGSAAVLFTLPGVYPIKLAGVMLVGIYGAHILWRYGLLRHERAVLRIRRVSDGRWQVQTHQRAYLADLCGDSLVTGLVSVLRFRVSNQFWKQSCIILRDSLEPDQYRQLLVALRNS